MTPVVLLWDCMAEALMRWPWREKERERKKVQLPGQMFKNKGKPQLLIRRNSRQAKEIKYHFLIFGNNPGFLIHLLHLDIIAAEREWDRKKQRLTYFFFFLTHAGGELVLLVGLAFFFFTLEQACFVLLWLHQQVAPVFTQHIRTLGQRSCLALFTTFPDSQEDWYLISKSGCCHWIYYCSIKKNIGAVPYCRCLQWCLVWCDLFISLLFIFDKTCHVHKNV